MTGMREKLTQAKIDSAIINPMKARYAPPRGLDHTWLLATMHRDLARFDEEILRQAFDRVRKEKPGRYSWPYPEEFEAAAEAATAERAAGAVTDGSGRLVVLDTFEKTRAVRDDFMAGQLGQEACANGWARAAVLFIESKGRVPDRAELVELRGSQDRLRRTLAGLRTSAAEQPENPLTRLVIGIGEGILGQEAKFANDYRRKKPADHAEGIIPY